MIIAEAEERVRLMKAQLAVSDSAEEQTVLRKRIAYLEKRMDCARDVEKIDPLALPPDGESITFKTDGKGSISKFRSDKELHYGADRELWPFYIRRVFEHMYSEGWAFTTPRAWIVKVEDLKRFLCGGEGRISSEEWRKKALAGLNDKTLPLPKVW